MKPSFWERVIIQELSLNKGVGTGNREDLTAPLQKCTKFMSAIQISSVPFVRGTVTKSLYECVNSYRQYVDKVRVLSETNLATSMAER